jgi:UDP-glucose 4-epimerase|tara:strand:+ start:7705 stop:8559 length:855 start_codon:yes stop_codon:yes gene_type:complete
VILVTGGAGFIGSHLIGALVKDENSRVISIDNYFTGLKENHIDGAEYIEGSTEDIDKLVKEKPDIVYHLGEYARIDPSFDDAKIVWNFNIAGTFRVLEFCKKNNSKLVYAGSSTKFGDGGLGRDQSPYAWTKAANTELIRNYGEWFGLSYAITYFYNVYGPRERSGTYGTVIEIFRELYLSGKPLSVVTPGTQRRNFTHVNDIVQGLLLIGEKGDGDEFGLGSKKNYSILEIAQMFNTEIDMLPERRGDRMSAGIDTSKSEALGWKSMNGVEKYIKNITSHKKS